LILLIQSHVALQRKGVNPEGYAEGVELGRKRLNFVKELLPAGVHAAFKHSI
jgi:hypothetical protein